MLLVLMKEGVLQYLKDGEIATHHTIGTWILLIPMGLFKDIQYNDL